MYGGRWNPKGIALLYTAESRALAAMKLAVHIDLNDLPEDLVSIIVELPLEVTVYEVPFVANWNRHPPDPAASVWRGRIYRT